MEKGHYWGELVLNGPSIANQKPKAPTSRGKRRLLSPLRADRVQLDAQSAGDPGGGLGGGGDGGGKGGSEGGGEGWGGGGKNSRKGVSRVGFFQVRASGFRVAFQQANNFVQNTKGVSKEFS